MNTIQVLLFANLREKAGVSSMQVTIEETATVNDVLEMVRGQYPALIPHLTEKVVIAINQQIALRSTRVPFGAEISLLPPVGGGSR